MVMYKMSKYDIIILQQQEIQKRDFGLGQTSNLSWNLIVKFMKSSTSGSVEFVWMCLDHPTRSIRLLQTDGAFEDRLREKRRSSYATNENLYDKVYVASFRRNLLLI